MSLVEEKNKARLAAQHRRDAIASAAASDAGERLAGHVMQVILSLPRPSAVSAFLPIGSEIEMRACFRQLRQHGLATCLPVVVEKGRALDFRLWQDGDALEAGPLGTRQPRATAQLVRPDVLLVPLLAYDDKGARLGWGGGFYDRTLARLKAENPATVAIGVAYDGQCMERVPVDEHDVPMDWIATEQRTISINSDKEADTCAF